MVIMRNFSISRLRGRFAVATATGAMTRRAYIDRYVPTGPLWDYVNQNVPSDAVILVAACICTGFMAGALWGAIPGWLKARYGSHEVITTIMTNFIAAAAVPG